ncbi:hypothetical protein RCL1_006003 [Eukaryota sp. TZLM3-RCL]
MSSVPEPLPSSKAERWFFMDWMRIFAVMQVLFVHALQFFDSHPQAYAFKLRPDTHPPIAIVDAYNLYGHMLGMPLLFIVSGASAVLAYSSKRNVFKTISARAFRLLLPLTVGLFLLIIPSKFITREYQVCGTQPNPDNFFYYYYFYFRYCFTGHGLWWLWFLMILFAVTSVVLPLIDTASALMLRPENAKSHRQSNTYFLIYCAAIALVCLAARLPYMCIVAMIIQLYVITGLLSTKVTSKQNNGMFAWTAFWLSFFARILFHIVLPSKDRGAGSWLFVVLGFTQCVIQGAAVVAYKDDFIEFVRDRVKLGYFGIVTFIFSLLIMGILGGQEDPRWDYLKFNGIYVTYGGGFGALNRMGFTISSTTLAVTVFLFSFLTLNHQVNPWFYRFMHRSTICVYMVHGLPQCIVAMLVRPLPVVYQTFLLVVIPTLTSYMLAILIDNTPYLRIPFGFSGAPTKLPCLKRREVSEEDDGMSQIA